MGRRKRAGDGAADVVGNGQRLERGNHGSERPQDLWGDEHDVPPGEPGPHRRGDNAPIAALKREQAHFQIIGSGIIRLIPCQESRNTISVSEVTMRIRCAGEAARSNSNRTRSASGEVSGDCVRMADAPRREMGRAAYGVMIARGRVWWDAATLVKGSAPETPVGGRGASHAPGRPRPAGRLVSAALCQTAYTPEIITGPARACGCAGTPGQRGSTGRDGGKRP